MISKSYTIKEVSLEQSIIQIAVNRENGLSSGQNAQVAQKHTNSLVTLVKGMALKPGGVQMLYRPQGAKKCCTLICAHTMCAR